RDDLVTGVQTCALPILPARSSFRPYGGGGLNIAHASAGPSGGTSVSETKAGLNLLGGTTFKLKGSKLTPFAEARGEVGGGKTFKIGRASSREGERDSGG